MRLSSHVLPTCVTSVALCCVVSIDSSLIPVVPPTLQLNGEPEDMCTVDIHVRVCMAAMIRMNKGYLKSFAHPSISKPG